VQLVIIGSGGFGREVFDVAGDQGIDVAGFVADYDQHLDEVAALGSAVLGGVDALSGLDARFVVGVGSPSARRALDERARALGSVAAPALRHSTSTVGREVRIGDGSVVCAHAAITTNCTLGRHDHVNLHASIGHDCVLGDFVTLAPGARISGHCTLADGVELGTNAAIIPGITVGEGAVIGAGAVVTKDVPPGVVAVGVPAKWRDPA
jgi:sugar O-acyltransferase (sialic acid O-acetyltransferase NeuD family)